MRINLNNLETDCITEMTTRSRDSRVCKRQNQESVPDLPLSTEIVGLVGMPLAE
jgi:hypothetical protein